MVAESQEESEVSSVEEEATEPLDEEGVVVHLVWVDIEEKHAGVDVR